MASSSRLLRIFVFLTLAIAASSLVIPIPKNKLIPSKYFSRAGSYDWRYFHDKTTREDRRADLRDLVRSYLSTFEDQGVETWLAHGTLLGWWWDARIIPWQDYVDMQVSGEGMDWLAEKLNHTQYSFNYTNAEGGESATRTYVLHVNPYRDDVGARWIDIDSGLYVDITEVRQRDRKEPKVWSSRTNQRYNGEELWPMRLSQFEGVKARIPYKYKEILVEEYGLSGLASEEQAG